MVESVLNPDYLENIGSLLADLDDVFVDSDELALAAAVFGTDEISYLETHQVYLPQYLVINSQLILG